ncbi:MAG: hypothetical protein H6953_12270 [Chromatiaceae bacterium]|nr:hypothetical protein [Chromatiaceae bacterium]MCP5315876.1 hypothetical protein [Chromatiaceae bacterium]
MTTPVDLIPTGLAGTTLGQSQDASRPVPQHVAADVQVQKDAVRAWDRLRGGVTRDIRSADNRHGRHGRLVLQLSSRRSVGGLRRSIRNLAERVGGAFALRRALRAGSVPRNERSMARFRIRYELPRLRQRLAVLCQFDRLAGQMRGTTLFGGSKSDKVAGDLAGLSAAALSNVNPDLRGDLLLAKEHQLLRVSKHFPQSGFGKVKSQRSRQLIRQLVAATLLQHGYAAAKLVKRDLTQYCALAERSGTSSGFARQVRRRMEDGLRRVNTGEHAAQVHVGLFPELNGKTEQANLRRVSAADWDDLLRIDPQGVPGQGDRDRIRDALIQEVAKGTLPAAQKLKGELDGKSALQQRLLADQRVQALGQSKAREPHTYYNPFRVDKDDGLDVNIQSTRRKYAGKPHYRVADSSYMGKPLKSVEDDHVVLIDGHGGDRFDAIAARQHLRDLEPSQRGAFMLSAEQLAARLEKDGLPKTHKTLRLLACYGGGSSLWGRDGDFSGSLAHNRQTDDAFAQRLAIALHARGYKEIVVGGYPGSVHAANDGSKQVAATKGSTVLIDAAGLCIYYDGAGQRVPNPRNPDKRLTDDQLNALLNQRL